MLQQLHALAQETHQQGTDDSTAPKLTETNIDEVLASMTLDEKAQMLVGGGHDGFVGSGAMMGHQERLVAGAAGITVAIPRLGIPATVLCDGPAGVHIDATRKGTDQTFMLQVSPLALVWPAHGTPNWLRK